MDDEEREFRIPVRSEDGPGEAEGASGGTTPHPASGVEPPRASRPIPFPGEEGEGDAEGGDPVILSIGDEEPAAALSSEPTVDRARFVELGRENLRLNEQLRKLQTELYQEKARAQSAGQAAEAKGVEAKEAVVRAQAEFQNYRRRIEREREETARYANADLLRDLLPVLDNFERALATLSGGAGAASDDFIKGIGLIYKQLQDVLAGYELRTMSVLGAAFDPNVHEAVTRAEHESAPVDEVIAEHQKGYYYKDRLLRPALVGVSAGAAGADSGESPAEDEAPGA